jgi:hypothetical protein
MAVQRSATLPFGKFRLYSMPGGSDANHKMANILESGCSGCDGERVPLSRAAASREEAAY